MALIGSGLWLKTIGTGDSPIAPDWLQQRPDVLRYVGFPDKGEPSVREYDAMAIYLAGHQKIVATVIVTSDPVWKPTKIKSQPGGRWPWIVTVEPMLVVPHVDGGTHIRDVGIRGTSVRSHSHIELDTGTWMRIVGGLAGASAIHGERYVAAYA